MEWFEDGGIIMWPMLISAIVMIGYAAAALQARRVDRDDDRARTRRDAVLFWAVFAAGLGILGTLIGIVMAAQAVEAAGSVSTALAWSGIRVALITTVFGLLIMLTGMLFWFGLGFARGSGLQPHAASPGR